jgi:ribose transport system permease protein
VVPVAEMTPEATLRSRATVVRDYGIIISFIALFVVLSSTAPNFLSQQNLLNILYQNAPIAIAACGTTFVIIAGAFDLSLGALFALGGVVAAWITIHTGSPVLGIVVSLLVCLVAGAFNGALVVAGINSFLATLATSLAFAGIAVAVTGGFLLMVDDPGFAQLGLGQVGAVRYASILLVAVAVVLSILLARTTFGRYVKAVGGNAEAARLSGVRVGSIRIATFALSGTCAGVAGLIAASRSQTGQADTGATLALDAIAAVVIGGTSILGGFGAIWRTLLGVFLMALITNGFDLLNVAPYFQDIFTGAIIIVAVAVNALSGRR